MKHEIVGKNYGKLIGFGFRINYRNKIQNDVVYNNAVFVCRKEGKRVADKRRVGVVHRWEERTSCKAKLNVVLERLIGKYKIKEFVAQHNHELEPPETSHIEIPYAKAGLAGLPGSSPEDGRRCSSLRCRRRKLAAAVRISAVWVHGTEVAGRVRDRRSPPSSSDLSADRASGMAVALRKRTDVAGDKEKRKEEKFFIYLWPGRPVFCLPVSGVSRGRAVVLLREFWVFRWLGGDCADGDGRGLWLTVGFVLRVGGVMRVWG
ncbi:Protein FAR1-RELATED SEQUENCE 5 [Striga hermonthica]|uniref:Protein FAR1-RELATED SEQUENCE 5 n=1 Tax=Striga hermonthica TaxID=68872 RepID=A0A9N7MJK2_STRHE|nr:Protein FAR1-RELATED SEQUENCE 5 [Striga hermonthica]